MRSGRPEEMTSPAGKYEEALNAISQKVSQKVCWRDDDVSAVYSFSYQNLTRCFFSSTLKRQITPYFPFWGKEKLAAMMPP